MKLRGKARQRERSRRRAAEQRQGGPLVMSQDRRQAMLRDRGGDLAVIVGREDECIEALTQALELGRVLINARAMSASLIGHSGSSAFRPTTTTAVSMSLTGSCFSSESAPGPSIMGVDDEAEQSTERPCCNERQVQAIGRTHLIHRPARDIIPPQGGTRVSSYRM